MTTKITEECINCGACEPECPNTAIYAGAIEYEWQGAKHHALSDDFYYIVPEKCTECVGFFDREACAAACPVDCCIPDPQCPETEEVLLARAKVLHPDKQFGADAPSRFRMTEREEPLAARGATATAQAVAAAAQNAAKDAAEAASAAAAAIRAPATAPAGVAAASVAASYVAAAAAKPEPAAAAVAAASASAATALKPAAIATAAKPSVAATPAAPASAAPKAPPAAAAQMSAAAAPGAKAAPPPAAAAGAPSSAAAATPPPAPRRLETTEGFEKLRDAVRGSSSARGSLRARLAQRLRRATGRDNGSTGFDGFASAAFESKRERERRYGEVYSIEEHPGGYYVRMELPRAVPPSAAKARLGIADEMPDYDLDVNLHAPELTINGHVAGQELRAVCGISTAFPPDFRTSIRLAGELAGLGYRYSGKVLEVVVSRRDGAKGRLSA